MTIWYAIVNVRHRDVAMPESYFVKPGFSWQCVVRGQVSSELSNQHHVAFSDFGFADMD